MYFLTVNGSLVRKYTGWWNIFQRFEIWALLHEMNEFVVISEKIFTIQDCFISWNCCISGSICAHLSSCQSPISYREIDGSIPTISATHTLVQLDVLEGSAVNVQTSASLCHCKSFCSSFCCSRANKYWSDKCSDTVDSVIWQWPLDRAALSHPILI